MGVFSRNAQRPCEGLPGLRPGGRDGSRWHRRGGWPAQGRPWCGAEAVGVFREMRNDPAQGLRPGGRDGSRWHRRGGWPARGGHGGEGGGGGRVFAKCATTLPGSCQGLHPGGRDGSRWHRRERMAGSGSAMVVRAEAVGVFSRNAQRPCEGLRGLHPGGRDGSQWHRRGRVAGSGSAMAVRAAVAGVVFAKRATTPGRVREGARRCEQRDTTVWCRDFARGPPAVVKMDRVGTGWDGRLVRPGHSGEDGGGSGHVFAKRATTLGSSARAQARCNRLVRELSRWEGGRDGTAAEGAAPRIKGPGARLFHPTLDAGVGRRRAASCGRHSLVQHSSIRSAVVATGYGGTKKANHTLPSPASHIALPHIALSRPQRSSPRSPGCSRAYSPFW